MFVPSILLVASILIEKLRWWGVAPSLLSYGIQKERSVGTFDDKLSSFGSFFLIYFRTCHLGGFLYICDYFIALMVHLVGWLICHSIVVVVRTSEYQY